MTEGASEVSEFSEADTAVCIDADRYCWRYSVSSKGVINFFGFKATNLHCS